MFIDKAKWNLIKKHLKQQAKSWHEGSCSPPAGASLWKWYAKSNTVTNDSLKSHEFMIFDFLEKGKYRAKLSISLFIHFGKG